MSKRIFIFLILALLITALTACTGDKQVASIEIASGLKTEYELGETPDFSALKVIAKYNDDSTREIPIEDLVISGINTSIVGTQNLDISYGGITITVSIKVNGTAYVPAPDWDYFVAGVSLPDSLALFETNKKDFLDKNQGYVVGDDNPFIFRLILSVFSADGTKLNVTNYAGLSSVYLEGSTSPLAGEELAKYVTVDEDLNTFDFTEEAIGLTFTITTSPRDGVYEEERNDYTKSLTVKVVDGYNVYEAYELNFITNTDLAKENEDLHADYPGGQVAVVDAFLKNEKNTTRPESLSSIVLHKNLDVKPTDLPAEYFINKDRRDNLHDYTLIFPHVLTEANPTFTIHGNYFAIYSNSLPRVTDVTGSDMKDMISSAFLFWFHTDVAKDMYFDHSKYVTTFSNVMLSGSAPNSDNLNEAEKSLNSLSGISVWEQTFNFENSKISAYLAGIWAERDYTTVNVNKSVLQSSYMCHFYIMSRNAIQEPDAEPLPKDQYPRMTLNVTSSIVKDSGGVAIFSQAKHPTENRNKHSGTLINISEDTQIENWVTGEEAFFKAMGISSFIATPVKYLNNTLLKYNSSVIKEEVKMVDGKQKTFKLFNIVYANIPIPDSLDSFAEIESFLRGTTDIDGKLVIGDKTVVDMDDYVIDGKNYNFGNTIISDLKSQSSDPQILTTQGGVAYTTINSGLKIADGSISAQSDKDYLTLYYYSLCLVFGDYHIVK